MFGVGSTTTGDWIRAQAEVAGAEGATYGIGLMAWAQPGAPEQVEAVLDLRPDLVSVSFGDIAGPVARLRDAGILTATQVGALPDLQMAQDAGVDVVVVRGAEGGGHGRNSMGTLPLLQMALEHTSDRCWQPEESSTIGGSLQSWQQGPRVPGSAPRSWGVPRRT